MSLKFTRNKITQYSILAVLLVGNGRALAAPPKTRASHLGATAMGLGKLLHMADYLREYPGSRTAILTYLKIDHVDMPAMIRDLRIQAAIQFKQSRDFWPQIALETENLSLRGFTQELARPDSRLHADVRMLAREIARYRERNKWYFLRPFSEMNDSTRDTPWEFGNSRHANTPDDFARAWMALRRAFDAEGATNVIWVFSPLAAHGVGRETQVLAALDRIPPGGIDAFGLNLYSRPLTAYGGASPEPISFAGLAETWIGVLQRSRHRGIPLAVAEMAVSSQATDAQRAKWLREAFRFTRSHNFVLITYFNFPHRYWHISDQTQAGSVLNAEINRDAPARALPNVILPPTDF